MASEEGEPVESKSGSRCAQSRATTVRTRWCPKTPQLLLPLSPGGRLGTVPSA